MVFGPLVFGPLVFSPENFDLFFLCVWFLAPLFFPQKMGGGQGTLAPPPLDPRLGQGGGGGVSPLPRCKENGN